MSPRAARGRSAPPRSVRVHVLGPLRVTVDGEDVAVAPGEAAVLATLVVAAEEGATTEAIAHSVWGDAQPRSVRQSVHNHVTRLRGKLHPGCVRLAHGRYRLAPEVVEVDAHLVGDQMREAEARLMEDGSLQALDLVDDALLLWRGRPFEEFDQVPRVDEMRALLEHTRAALRDLRIDALVANGRTGTAIVELYDLVGQDPTREGDWIRLVRLLHGSGRRGDAMAAFHAAREALGAHLGLEPSQALRDAVEAVLLDGDEHDEDGPHAAVARDPAVRDFLAGSPAPARVLDLVAGGNRHVLLRGDAGTDVSSLAQVAAERLAASGHGTVLTARCVEHPGSALQPLRDVAVLLDDRGWLGGDGADLEGALGLAQLVAPVRSRPAEVGPLIDRVVDDLLRVADRVGGLVLVIADAQRAGPTTRSVLSRIAVPQGPVVVIGAWNGDDPGEHGGDQEIGAAATVHVQPFTLDQTRDLVRRLVGAEEVSDDLVAQVHAHTAGSPLFVTEVVADLRRRGALRRDPDGTAAVVGAVEHQLRQVPRTISHVVRRRLAALDDRITRVLEVTAALGDPTRWVLLVDLVGREDAERAVAQGLLDLDPDVEPGGRVWFRHPLLGSVVRETIPRGRVLEYNYAAAHAAATHGLGHSVIAWHRVAATQLEPGGVVRAAWDAGDAALVEQTFPEAAAWFRLAGDALARDRDPVETAAGPRPRELASIELEILRANALRLSGDPDHTALLLDAAQAALESGDSRLQRLAAQMVTPLGGTSEAGRLPRRALEIVEQVLEQERDPASRALIASSASLLMSMAGAAERCRALYVEADRISADLGDPAVRAAVLPYAYLGLGHPADLDARDEAGRELWDLARRLDDDVAAFEAHHLMFSTAIQRADGAAVRAAHAAMGELLDRVADAGRRWSWHYQEAAIAHLEGRLADAARAAQTAREVGHGLAVSRAEAAYAGQMLDIARASGGLAELLEHLAGLVVDQPTMHAWHAAYALAVAETAELVTRSTGPGAAELVARHVAAVLDPAGGAAGHQDFTAVPALFVAGRAAARKGLRNECRRLWDALTPYSGLMVWQGTCTYGPVDLVLGHLAAALGRPTEAVDLTAAAAAQARSLGAPLFAAECEGLLAVLPEVVRR